MEQKINMSVFYKIGTFFLLTWICHFVNDDSKLNNILNAQYNVDRKLGTRTYRLLARHKNKNDSDILFLNEEMPNNRVYNKKGETCRRKRSNGSSFNNEEDYEQIGKSIPYLYTKRCSNPNKRKVDKLYYLCKVRNIMNTDITNLRSSVRDKYVFLITSFIVLLGIAAALTFALNEKSFEIGTIAIDSSYLPEFIVLLAIPVIILLIFIYIFRNVVKTHRTANFKCKLHKTKHVLLK
ncbi:Plasmodium exported protein, unknown function [Plasmodium malariae]|uniref:Uncharacterized protein n=1 Tax=Plasmodium malariae TaxID=5858 RepID=A0A1D3PB38_PLAMA|nr:Plasmodium exported protein, unknown function [Plasmodium malariae]SCN12414.1 Plasmodium exported protein, unknown function [Plasmodium malariae]